MSWETWTHRRRRVAGLLTNARIPILGGRYELPYCGRMTPFPSDYVLPDWTPFVATSLGPLFPGTFVDVGANVGQSMLFVRDFNPQCDYIGFEPNPISYVIAQQTIRLNGIKGCKLIPAGLSDRCGTLALESNSETDPSSTVISGFRAPGLMKLRSHVVVLRGDEALASVDCAQVGILKIDVEGGELEVMRGLRGTLEASRPLVICEVLALHDTKSVGDFRVARQRALEQILLELNFVIYRLEPPGTVRLVAAVPDDGQNHLVDYFFVPKERQTEFVVGLRGGGFVLV